MLAGKFKNASKKDTFIRTISACRAAGDIAANMPPKLPPELNMGSKPTESYSCYDGNRFVFVRVTPFQYWNPMEDWYFHLKMC